MPTTTIAAIDRQLDFRASPERLWRALTEDGELARGSGSGRSSTSGRAAMAGSSSRGTAACPSGSRCSSR